jgi:hypothetical protein
MSLPNFFSISMYEVVSVIISSLLSRFRSVGVRLLATERDASFH